MKLPNGWQVSNKAEMEGLFIYNEIFQDDCYGKHGIRIADGDTVVDVGANVGQNSSSCVCSPPAHIALSSRFWSCLCLVFYFGPMLLC